MLLAQCLVMTVFKVGHIPDILFLLYLELLKENFFLGKHKYASLINVLGMSNKTKMKSNLEVYLD